MADLSVRFQVQNVGDIPVLRAEEDGPHRLRLVLRNSERQRLQRLARILSPPIVNTIAHDPTLASPDPNFTSNVGTWGDPGRFFNKAAEFFDPVQGAVANCYFIAALSAVAWARPFQINNMTRATGTEQQRFTNLIRFYTPGGGTIDAEIEVTDFVPMRANGNLIYARSSEAGEIWPCLYEKAFAKLETGHQGDRPNILATALGAPAQACARLTEGTKFAHKTKDLTADELWSIVRENSLSHRTVNPMVCLTYSTAQAAQKDLVYSDVNIAANHAYTVLGWDFLHGQKFIVLRNPWARTEASFGALDATFWSRDISWWRPI